MDGEGGLTTSTEAIKRRPEPMHLEQKGVTWKHPQKSGDQQHRKKEEYWQ